MKAGQDTLSKTAYSCNNKSNQGRHLAPFEFIQCNMGERKVYDKKTASYFYYLDRGLVKCQDSKSGRIIWFEDQKNYFSLPEVFMNSEGSKFEILAAESCSLYRIARAELMYLVGNDIMLSEWWIKTIEREYLRLYKFYCILDNNNPLDKFIGLQMLIPAIEDRANIKDLASFTGIKPESLRKIITNTKD